MASPEQLAALEAVVPFAQATQAKWHVPASVSLAQWVFESGWGTDRIAVEINNCFGIKHLQANRTEPYKAYYTREYAPGAKVAHIEQQEFVRYPSIAACFEAHGRLIGGTTRYMSAIAVSDDVPAFCRAIQGCGYSTNPRYAKMLLDEIAVQNLTQYDTRPAVDVPAKVNA